MRDEHLARINSDPFGDQHPRYSRDLQLPTQAQAEIEAAAPQHKQIKVKSGDTLAQIFERVGLSAQQLHELMQLGKPVKKLTRLIPGQELHFHIDGENRLAGLDYKLDRLTTLHVQRNESGDFTSLLEEREYDRRVITVKGDVESSLFEAGQKAGLSDNMTMEMAALFGWDIDFALDIRDGDSFVVMYEELFLDGKKIRDGNIIAAEFINQDKPYRAIRFTDPSGRTDYYDPKGRSMRKAFLRTPVDFARISSRYGKRRHPVLNRVRAHKGVDYAAPRGTPIRAAGEGKIVHRGKKGGYGRTIIIQHGNRYSTLYAHMKSYARGTRSGSRVRQGQIIGYVGSSGLATGPHLHYEFRVFGRHRNPLTVKLPDAAPINKAYKNAYMAKARPLLAQLSLFRNPNLAFSDLR